MQLDHPLAMSELSSHISMGGSPVEWAKIHKIQYDKLIAWIYDDPLRTKSYEVALAARGEWFVQRVLLELRRISTADLRDAYGEDGCLRPIAELSDDLAACISSVTTRELRDEDGVKIGEVVDVNLWDKPRALIALGKSLALFFDRHEHNHNVTVQVMDTITVDGTPLTYRLGGNNN